LYTFSNDENAVKNMPKRSFGSNGGWPRRNLLRRSHRMGILLALFLYNLFSVHHFYKSVSIFRGAVSMQYILSGDPQDAFYLDEHLHRLSNPSLSNNEWQRVVRLHISNPLVKTLLETKSCRVLDVGCGGGSFSRSLLQLHNGVQILGVDHSKKMIQTSQLALGRNASNFKAAVASMEDATSMQKAVIQSGSSSSFHIALLIDSLCYMPDSQAVQQAIANALDLLDTGGLLVASMIPETLEAMQSCNTLIGRDVIISMGGLLGYNILNFTEMSHWGIGNQTGRYSFVLKKTGQRITNDTVPVEGVSGRRLDSNLTEAPVLKYLLDVVQDVPGQASVSELKIRHYQEAQKVLHYIVSKLQEDDIPLMLNWGTALYEFRAGTESTFVPDVYDKDIDITVFEQHFGLILGMIPDISRLFGWKEILRKSSVSVLVPAGERGKGSNSLQIDIYSFQCKITENLAYFPWDKVTFRLNTILPLRPHTRISNQTLYMPSDPACMLENLFGPDFRTPKKTSHFAHYAVDNPICKAPTHDASEKLEFMRQLSFCEVCDPLTMNLNAMANFSSGLQTTAPLCPG